MKEKARRIIWKIADLRLRAAHQLWWDIRGRAGMRGYPRIIRRTVKSMRWSINLADQGLHEPEMAIRKVLIPLFAGRHCFLGGAKAFNGL